MDTVVHWPDKSLKTKVLIPLDLEALVSGVPQSSPFLQDSVGLRELFILGQHSSMGTRPHLMTKK